jgi:short-subunit dehydrogenase
MISNPRPLAVVTGASSGIGASLARELARDGHDLLLVARRVEPMQALAAEVRAVGASTTVLAADLGKAGASAALAGEIGARGVPVEVLVNAAGLGANGRFDRSDPPRVSEMLQVNVLALTELTRLLLPGMVARGRGKVMLLASTAAFQPGPQMAVYCATKAYVLSFGEAIAYELRGSGVSVTVLCPGATATEFSRVAGASGTALFNGSLLPVMTPADVARIGYRAFKDGRRVVVTGLINRVMAAVSRKSPTAISMPISAFMMSASSARPAT